MSLNSVRERAHLRRPAVHRRPRLEIALARPRQPSSRAPTAAAVSVLANRSPTTVATASTTPPIASEQQPVAPHARVEGGRRVGDAHGASNDAARGDGNRDVDEAGPERPRVARARRRCCPRSADATSGLLANDRRPGSGGLVSSERDALPVDDHDAPARVLLRSAGRPARDRAAASGSRARACPPRRSPSSARRARSGPRGRAARFAPY